MAGINSREVLIEGTELKGKGVFAGKSFKKNDLIFVIAGPIVKDTWTHYTIPISVHLCIDPVPVDNPAASINHSCEPNAGLKSRTMVVAYRDIAKGEEISLDYAMIVDEYGDEITDAELACRCGSERCRGKLGSYAGLPRERREAYEGFVSEWILDLGI